MRKSFDIIIVHKTKMFEAEKIKEDAVVFINSRSCDEDEWSLIKCDSKKQRKLLLKIMTNKEENGV